MKIMRILFYFAFLTLLSGPVLAQTPGEWTRPVSQDMRSGAMPCHEHSAPQSGADAAIASITCAQHCATPLPPVPEHLSIIRQPMVWPPVELPAPTGMVHAPPIRPPLSA
jgi:hypothetical protein